MTGATRTAERSATGLGWPDRPPDDAALEGRSRADVGDQGDQGDERDQRGQGGQGGLGWPNG